MANLRNITKNRLIIEANKKRLQALIFVQIFLIGIFFILKQLLPERQLIVYLTTIIMTYILFKKIPNVGVILRAGGKGEQKALRMLKKLPKKYTIFNQVNIPFYPNSEKTQEIDYVIVGPTAVFIVEVKNNSGQIMASRQNEWWLVRQKQYTKSLANPIKQLDRQITILGKFLTTTDLYPRIIGTLLFVHKTSDLKIPKDMRELIFTDKKIVKWIKRQEHNQPLIDAEIIVSLLQIVKKIYK
ncbi:MAG: hypothetical protein HeimC3_18190 [Candidatus Heimdallarchaeota archaeon LC_3]|nr:MAG: hypothetical protein HeimC3_18190 [Candidatus Heimdallarchaeota archaeon LC_3]